MRRIGVNMKERFYTKSEVIERHHLLPSGRFHKTVIVWLSNTDNLHKLLKMFTETAMFCFQYIDVGVYNPNDG